MVSDCSQHNLFYTFLELYDLELQLYKFPILMGKGLIPVVLFLQILMVTVVFIEIVADEIIALLIMGSFNNTFQV